MPDFRLRLDGANSALEHLVTYQDLVEHALDYCGAAVDVENRRKAMRAVNAAYRDMASGHRWRYYLLHGRLSTVASQTEGTVAYDHTGGANERQLTLTSSTWPDWAAYGVVVIAGVPYEVDSRVSSTILTLSTSSNPGADVAASTEYTLYRDTYLLPTDFQESAELIIADQMNVMQQISPQEWAQIQRSNFSPSLPWAYTFTGDHNRYGGMAVRFFPAPAGIYPINYAYKRYPRALKLWKSSVGKVTTTASSATISGTQTAFTDAMLGSVIRISSSTTEEPTWVGGESPATFERIITARASATSITVDATVDQSLTTVCYTISDPVDIEAGSMLTLLFRLIEKHMRLVMRMQITDIENEAKGLRDAYLDAYAADSRSFSREAAGTIFDGRIRDADMPWTAV